MMAIKVTFQYLFTCQCICFVLGTLIDPQKPESTSSVHVHCLYSSQVIQIKNPFSPSIINDRKFISTEWYQLLSTGPNSKPKETLLLQFLQNRTIVPTQRFTQFEFWGLQINNVSLQDSATYIAKLVHLGPGQQWSANIVIATPPLLESEKLLVSRSVGKDGHSATITCGRISSLGSPPVSFNLKTDSGTEIPAVYKDGYLQLNLTSELDAEKNVCGLDFNAPAAQCITELDMHRWKLTMPSAVHSADNTDIIAGVSAVGAVIFIIIVFIVFIMMRKRFKKTEVYNAREHEKKRDQENGFVNTASIHKDKEKAHERSNDSIYDGFNSQESFMITAVSDGNTSLIYNKAKSQNTLTKNMVYLNGKQNTQSGKSGMQMEGKDRQKQSPQTSPRSIFLTPSMEELDKTAKTLNAGLSNGSAVNRGTLV